MAAKAINIVNMDGLEWKRSKYNKFTQRFLKWAESLAAKNAHTMIADSPDMQKYLLNTYGKRPITFLMEQMFFLIQMYQHLRNMIFNLINIFLLISRMEPENNIEMIIKGHLASNHPDPLLIIGNITNKFGRYITANYKNAAVKIFRRHLRPGRAGQSQVLLFTLFSWTFGRRTNPSLLEAMACGCRIAAHANHIQQCSLTK
jgi:hypothetical protein